MRYAGTCIALIIGVCVILSANCLGAGEILIGYTGPLSGPAAEYGQDVVNGLDMAVRDLNSEGGVSVAGKRYQFRIERLDDRVNPAQAAANARKLRADGAIAIWNPVSTTLKAIMKVNEEKGCEFIMMAYTSNPRITEMKNKFLVAVPPPFSAYSHVFTEQAWLMGWRKAAMFITLGEYGDEWRRTFRRSWENKGGSIVADKSANYYAVIDFYDQLLSVVHAKPDVILIGGPSATTALVIEQARSLGYKGGLLLVEQAKMDSIANLLNGYKLIGDAIGISTVSDTLLPASASFDRKYTGVYKRMSTWEAIWSYASMFALARAVSIAGTVEQIPAIRSAFPRTLPLLGENFSCEIHGMTVEGRLYVPVTTQVVRNGKPGKPSVYFWWIKSKDEFSQTKKLSKYKLPVNWLNPVD